MCLRTVLCKTTPPTTPCPSTRCRSVQAACHLTNTQLMYVGPLVVVEGRHPTLEAAMEGRFQANSTYLAEACSLHIITGPNMAGKSTYLRQVTDRLNVPRPH